MAIELQLEQSVLTHLTAVAAQGRLRSVCMPPFVDGAQTYYVDHLDLDDTPLVLTQTGDSVEMRMPIEVFATTRDAVLAAPNGQPVGSTTPAATITAILVFSAIAEENLEFRPRILVACAGVDPASTAGLPDPVRTAIDDAVRTSIGTVAEIPLTAFYQSLEIDLPISADCRLAGSAIAFRFGVGGPAVPHLFAGQEWGLFLESGTLTAMLAKRLPAAVRPYIDSRWTPQNGVPKMKSKAVLNASVGPLEVDITATFDSTFSLTPGATKQLRLEVSWSFEFDANFVPAFVEAAVEDYAYSQINPATLGTPLSPTSFRRDLPLPPMSWGEGRMLAETLIADDSGMTLGGRVRLLATLDETVLGTSINTFGRPSIVLFCSRLAAGGSGEPPRTVKPNQVSTNARLVTENAGGLCGIEILSPSWIEPFVHVSDGPGPGESEVVVSLGADIAPAVTEPVRLLLRTPRGVRLIDLGKPPQITLDENGNVVGANINWIDDCNYVQPGGGHSAGGITWGSGGLPPIEIPPFEHPDWGRFVGSRGVEVQVVTVTGLDAGEMVSFRSPNHTVDVVADAQGVALVPVLLQLTSKQAPAVLTRANRKSLAGQYSIATAVFTAEASLPHASDYAITGSGAGARLQTRLAGNVRSFAVQDARLPLLTGTNQGETDEATMVNYAGQGIADLGIEGVVATMRVPGHEELPLVLATLTDGSTLLVDLAADKPRVSGTLRGPLPGLASAGDWAVGATRNRLAVYRVTRS